MCVYVCVHICVAPVRERFIQFVLYYFIFFPSKKSKYCPRVSRGRKRVACARHEYTLVSGEVSEKLEKDSLGIYICRAGVCIYLRFAFENGNFFFHSILYVISLSFTIINM